MDVSLEATDPFGEDATRLAGGMSAEVGSRYHDVLDPLAPPIPNDPPRPRSVFILARLEGVAVGCAALRPMDAEAAEVRRMYVNPEVRRRGIARRLLVELEERAAEFGYRFLRLETGIRQPEAIALYESSGFRRIPPFGCHVNDPLSLCFEKPVARPEIRGSESEVTMCYTP